VQPNGDADFDHAVDALAGFLSLGLAAPGEAWPPLSLLDLAPAPADPKAAPKEAFLAAATEAVNAYGYKGASVDRISAQLNRTKGAFYHHNADKDEVVTACFGRTFDMMREALERSAGAPSGWHRLAQASAALAISHNAPSGRMLRTFSLAGLPAPMRERMARGFVEAAAGFAEVVASGVADGSLRRVPPGPAGHMVMAMVNSSAYLGGWAPEIGRDNVVEAYVRPALMGLAVTA
jgi:AcrR family transcriptional regulator